MGWFGNQTIISPNLVPGEYEDLEVGGDVVGLNGEKLKPTSGEFADQDARAMEIHLEYGDVRYRYDGGNPTITDGILMVGGDARVIQGLKALKNYRVIGDGLATWQAETPYAVGDRVIPTTPGNYYYLCTRAGTSGAVEPEWGTTPGGTTTDGSVTWICHQLPKLRITYFFPRRVG